MDASSILWVSLSSHMCVCLTNPDRAGDEHRRVVHHHRRRGLRHRRRYVSMRSLAGLSCGMRQRQRKEDSVPPSPPLCLHAGKHKEKTYDPERKLCMLLPAWVSRASAIQRKGERACVCLFVASRPYSTHSLLMVCKHRPCGPRAAGQVLAPLPAAQVRGGTRALPAARDCAHAPGLHVPPGERRRCNARQ